MDQYLTLNSGHKMPVIGLGTWKSDPGRVAAAVEYALTEAGYKHLDCAAIYRNEAEVGQALNKVFSGNKVKREDVFITSKLWNNMHARGDVVTACKQTLKDLQLDYLDLYLMHWGIATPRDIGDEPLDKDGYIIMAPVSVRETWEAMEELVKLGLVKSIGVSNFMGPMLIDLLTYAKIKPAMNQIEMHPYNQQQKMLDFAKHINIALTGYSPLGSPGNVMARGNNEPILVQDPVILEIAKKHNKTVYQILLRWAIERGTITIPKSTTPENLKANMQVFDFELPTEDMERIKKLDRHLRFVNPKDWYMIPYFE